MAESNAGDSLTGSGSISDRVYAWLRQRILTGVVKPGELIDEKKICARFSISRTPVREAVKRLSDEHLVDVVAQSATRASQLDPDSIHEAFLIRRALEMESAANAAVAMSQQHTAQQHTEALESIIDRHVINIERKKYAAAIDVDDEFHAYIAEISGLRILWRTVEISKAQLDRCRHIMLPKFGEAESTIEHHRRIVRALKTGDEAQSRAAMKQHLDIAYQSSRTMFGKTALSFPLEPKPGGRGKKLPESDR